MSIPNYSIIDPQQDVKATDSLSERPLPKWLTDQRDSLNYWQPVKAEMKDDHYLELTLGTTGLLILLTLIIATRIILRKGKK